MKRLWVHASEWVMLLSLSGFTFGIIGTVKWQGLLHWVAMVVLVIVVIFVVTQLMLSIYYEIIKPKRTPTKKGEDNMIDLRQKDLADWAEKNFGERKADVYKCVLGMMEELGELSHWLLKRSQGIREPSDGRDCKSEIGDAFADVVIYGIQAMNCEGIDAETVIKDTIEKVLKRDRKNNPSGEGESQHKEVENG